MVARIKEFLLSTNRPDNGAGGEDGTKQMINDLTSFTSILLLVKGNKRGENPNPGSGVRVHARE
jgi:hypothetical protein